LKLGPKTFPAKRKEKGASMHGKRRSAREINSGTNGKLHAVGGEKVGMGGATENWRL